MKLSQMKLRHPRFFKQFDNNVFKRGKFFTKGDYLVCEVTKKIGWNSKFGKAFAIYKVTDTEIIWKTDAVNKHFAIEKIKEYEFSEQQNGNFT